MGLFGKLIQLGVQVVTAPVPIVKDVVTLGGALTDKDEPYTATRIKEIGDKAEQIYDSLD
jgi:hypothetical protein